MPAYEDDDRFEPIAPVQPVRCTHNARPIRRMRPRPYQGECASRATQALASAPEEPAAILDISPQAREQAHHLHEEASGDAIA